MSVFVRLLLVAAFAIPSMARVTAGEVRPLARSATVDAPDGQKSEVVATRVETYRPAFTRQIPAPAILSTATRAGAEASGSPRTAGPFARRTRLAIRHRGRAPPALS